MTDKEKTPEVPKEKAVSKKTPAAKKKTEKSTPPKQKKSSGISWFLIIVVLLAIGAGVYAYKELNRQITQTSDAIATSKQSNASALNDLTEKTNHLNASANSLADQLENAHEKIELLEKQAGKNKRQWLIAEAEYLTSVANTRLLLAGDVNAAIVALQTADLRLKENGSPVTFDIRQQLAKEIGLLKSAELPDVVGLSSQLLALESAVTKMDISEPHAGTAQAPQIGNGSASPIPENIQETLNEAWENFSKLVVVRRHDKPMSALMTPEQVELIRKNLALKLEAARLALIKQDEALYKANIAISIDWLNDYFNADNSSVKAALDQLKQLQDARIKAELPSIHLSLKMIRDIDVLAIPEQKVVEPTSEETPPPSLPASEDVPTTPDTAPEQIDTDPTDSSSNTGN